MGDIVRSHARVAQERRHESLAPRGLAPPSRGWLESLFAGWFHSENATRLQDILLPIFTY